jgi:hypothetical protein
MMEWIDWKENGFLYGKHLKLTGIITDALVIQAEVLIWRGCESIKCHYLQ